MITRPACSLRILNTFYCHFDVSSILYPTEDGRLMCGAYFLEDGKDLMHYYIEEGSVIHPLYERYGKLLQ